MGLPFGGHAVAEGRGSLCRKVWESRQGLYQEALGDGRVGVDTAVAHLAGALGRPVFLAAKYVPEWRWGIEGEGNPWYPTMRVFRQSSQDDWAPVFARMQSAVNELLTR